MARVLADLHIHSRFSRATSKSLDPESLHHWGSLKGLDVVGTGDMTHPVWLEELSKKLEKGEDGLYSLSGAPPGPRFVPTGEIS
jgi:PHP family Zn ribbon phosphoesterase